MMSKSKRFVIGDDNLAMFEVIDMVKEELVCECRAVDVEKVVSLLNELDTKCSHLKKENKQLKCINDQLEERLENSGIGVALKMDCDKDE